MQQYLRPKDASLLAYAAAPRRGHTAFLAAHLTGAQNVHAGGFASGGSSKRGWRGTLDITLARSPALCECLGTTCSLHIVVDTPALTSGLPAGVVAHQFAPQNSTLGNERRYELFERVLSQTAWECAFLIDLDVYVMTLPPCDLLVRNRTLAVGSDDLLSTLNVKRWMKMKAVGLRYCDGAGANFTCSSALMEAYLKRRVLKHEAFACGMVGGPRAVLLPALANANAKFREHWARYPEVRLLPGLDMLVWNEIVVGLRQTGDVVTGYPLGPVNLMRSPYPWAHGVRGRHANETVAFVNATRGLFWLTHPGNGAGRWIPLLETWARECSTRSVGS